MRRAPLIALMLLAAAPAGAAGLSVGHAWLDNGAPLDHCMARATRAVQPVGLQLMDPTSRAVWAENPAQDQLYVLYCIPERAVVTVTGTAARFEDVDPVVTRLREAFRNATVTPGPARKR